MTLRYLRCNRALKGIPASLVLLAAIGQPTKVIAQTFTCTATRSAPTCAIPGQIVFNSGGVISLQLSTATTALTPPTSADYNTGFNNTVGPVLTVSANQSWTLHLRAAAPLWTAGNTGGSVARASKPAADLKWSRASNGLFTSLSTTDVTVLSGSAGGGVTTTLFFRTVYNWSLDTPGHYSLSLLFTLTAP